MPDPTKIDKAIREMRKGIHDAEKILRDIKPSLFEPNKDQYKPIKTVNAFNNNYIQYKSVGDKGKTLSIK